MTEPKQRQAEQIYALMNKVMADIGAVPKGQRNAAQGYNFRGIDDALAAVQPVLVKHGIILVPEVIASDVRDASIGKNATPGARVVLTVKHTFFAPDGSSVSAVTVGEGLDTSDKACNKAMSGAFKYAIFETFCIPTDEQACHDSDHESPQIDPPAKPADKKRLLAEVAKYRGDETDISHTEFVKNVIAGMYGEGAQLTVAQLEAVRQAILTGGHDKATGEKMPDAT